MASKVVAFTGPSNSGKTTLIEKIIAVLTPNFKVAVIKHDPKDKAIFDVRGKDSYKFFSAGADVCVISPSRVSIFKREICELEEVILRMKPFDYLFVEGLKELILPRIGVFRGAFDASYLNHIDAIAVDESVQDAPSGITKLNLNCAREALDWINKNAKEI